ncbi:hypothetical protein CMO86_10005 [Candidatus Woesearchaeota archaeon]|jgi:hypothetical protein|nr:hypothetical protein [Candidatus Woesearchaeota archaeon]|tara:strand:- start:1443 stop:1667 length:225 start_codon:yes stop_codon:yes gene_type:complete
MNNYVKVESDQSLVRDLDSNAIVNTDKDEYQKFLNLSEKRYKEKMEYENLKTDVKSLKDDLNEIKSLLKSIVDK